MQRLSVIIVNYNTRDFLRKCLINLKDIYENVEVIVVDNDSNDGSYEILKSEFSWVYSLQSENLGISHAYNLGFEKSSGEYILYLGTDAFPTKDTLFGMIKYMEVNGLVGISTPKLVLDNGEIDLDCHRGFPTPWASLTHFVGLNKLFPKSALFNHYFLGSNNMDIPHEIDLCISHFMLVRRTAQNMIGSWDESFFVYGEDVDFCYRIKKAGWKIMYLPQFEVKHLKGVSVGIRRETSDISTASDATKNRMKKETTRAMKLFYKKHLEVIYPDLVNKCVYYGIDFLEKVRSFSKF